MSEENNWNYGNDEPNVNQGNHRPYKGRPDRNACNSYELYLCF